MIRRSIGWSLRLRSSGEKCGKSVDFLHFLLLRLHRQDLRDDTEYFIKEYLTDKTNWQKCG